MTGPYDVQTEDLKVVSRREADAVVLAIHGEVTVFSSPALRQVLRRVVGEKPERVVLDLAGTTYVDSSGVATFVEALQSTSRAKGKLVLAGMNERVRGVFEIARLDTVFTVARDVQEALRT
jgi:anti-sigma B factor antagonist